MRAELFDIYSFLNPEVRDLRAWSPEDHPMITVQLIAGAEGGRGREAFNLFLCTAEWLAQRAAEEGIVDCRHTFVVSNYNYDELERYFRERVSECEGATWEEVAAKVGRIGEWEFEDYRENGE